MRIVRLLHIFTKKNELFEWTNDGEKAFKTLKQKLAEALVLAFPHFKTSFKLDTDASGSGLEQVLTMTKFNARD